MADTTDEDLSETPVDATAPALVTAGLSPDIASPPAEPPRGRSVPAAPAIPVSKFPMWVLGLVVLMDEIDKNIVRGLITPLKAEFGVGDFGIGVLLSSFIIVNGLITVPAGYLADRWNRSRTVGHTVVGWSAITAVGGLAPNFGVLVALRSSLGFGQAITEPSAASLIGDYYPVEQRGRAFSIQQVMVLAGAGIGVGLGGTLGELVGWRWALVVVALPGLLVAALVYRLREPKRGAADRLGAGATDLEAATEHPDLFERGFGQFCRDMLSGLVADGRTIINIRTMRYALVGVAALLFTVTAVASWLPQFYSRHLGIAEGDAERWFALLAIAGGVPGVLLGGRVADRYADRIQGARLALPAVFVMVGNLLFTISYTLRSFAPAFALQLVGLFVVTMAIPGLRAGLTDAVPAHLRGAGFGAFNLVAVIFGAAAAPTVVAALSAAFDENLRTAFLIVSPWVFLGGVVLFRARKFLDDDMQKIMLAVLTAMQEEQERETELAAEQGKQPG
ncbi:MFS transporter [soil metagenome]